MSRRFQFRLRTLMLAVTILAVQCAVCLPALKQWLERRGETRIKSHFEEGAHIRYTSIKPVYEKLKP